MTQVSQYELLLTVLINYINEKKCPPPPVQCVYPTISHHNSAVLLTLLLAVEFVAIALAASIFEGHTLSHRRIESPQV